MTFINLYY